METTDAAREIIEVLHTQLEVLRDQLTSAHDRERFLRALLESDAARDRETKLIDLLVTDRKEIDRLRAELRAQGPRHHSAITHEAAARPVAPSAVSRPPGALHARIVAAVEACPGEGMTAKQLESALASPKPLADICSGLVRRGVLVRVGAGRFALPVGELVGAVGVNGTGA
jgi:hypothetical protein